MRSRPPDGTGETPRTRDGVPFTIRPISPADKEALVSGFERLSSRSRYRRFLGGVAHLTPSEVAYFTEVDHRDHEALVAISGDGEMIGVARYVRLAERPRAADLAITVADRWQGRGIGTMLLRRLAQRATSAGVDVFVATCLASNHEVMDLLEELGAGATARREDAGVVTIEVELPTATDQAMRPALRAAAAGRLRQA